MIGIDLDSLDRIELRMDRCPLAQPVKNLSQEPPAAVRAGPPARWRRRSRSESVSDPDVGRRPDR